MWLCSRCGLKAGHSRRAPGAQTHKAPIGCARRQSMQPAPHGARARATCVGGGPSIERAPWRRGAIVQATRSWPSDTAVTPHSRSRAASACVNSQRWRPSVLAPRCWRWYAASSYVCTHPGPSTRAPRCTWCSATTWWVGAMACRFGPAARPPRRADARSRPADHCARRPSGDCRLARGRSGDRAKLAPGPKDAVLRPLPA